MFFKNRFTLCAESVLRISHQCAAELGHGYVGSEHILVGLASQQDSRAGRALEKMGITTEKIKKRLREDVGTGECAIKTLQGLTPSAHRIVKLAHSIAAKKGNSFIGTEHLLLGIITDGENAAKSLLCDCGADVEKLKRGLLSVGDEKNDKTQDATGRAKERADVRLIKSYGRDLCELAELDKLDPVIGREKEIERLIRILVRRTKNNPLLLGEPGVGKTAVAEGLALKITEGSVPAELADKRIYVLDISSVVAGTKYRGEFEERIRTILKEVKRAKNIILFIDEIHTIVGAGSAEGAIDAANILKPALSRREIQVIGATTFSEYKKYIERDAALERRFQPVNINEPNEEESIKILSELKKKYEEYHKIRISEEAVCAAVRLSSRYINDRYLPDKAIDLLDEAASKAKLYSTSPPQKIKELREKIIEVASLKEHCARSQDFEAAARLRDCEMKLQAELYETDEKWKRVVAGNAEIGEDSIAEAVSEQTGIPVSRINENESIRLYELEKELSRRVVGQKEAVGAVARAVRRGRLGISDPKRPMGVFLFAGPTGVGKTELARALASSVFGDEKMMIRVDMSEYMEKHEVAKLIGPPPGYVGYDDSTTLIDKVRRKPYCVVLLDEIEKAHTEVHNLLLQVFEDGTLSDSHGKSADFKNTIIVMTSNMGAEKFSGGSVGFASGDEHEENRMRLTTLSEVKRVFTPELVNRIDDIVVFNRLSKKELLSILDLMLEKLFSRVREIGAELFVSEEAKELVIEKGYDKKYGARPLRRALQTEIEDPLAERILKDGRKNLKYKADVSDGKIVIGLQG